MIVARSLSLSYGPLGLLSTITTLDSTLDSQSLTPTLGYYQDFLRSSTLHYCASVSLPLSPLPTHTSTLSLYMVRTCDKIFYTFPGLEYLRKHATMQQEITHRRTSHWRTLQQRCNLALKQPRVSLFLSTSRIHSHQSFCVSCALPVAS